jgi:hypothetical protein
MEHSKKKENNSNTPKGVTTQNMVRPDIVPQDFVWNQDLQKWSKFLYEINGNPFYQVFHLPRVSV